MKDFYRILNVDEDASYDEIKRSYRVLAKRYHPDVSGGNEESFKEITEAYKVLSDSSSREDYDTALKDLRGGTGALSSYLTREYEIEGKNLGRFMKELIKQVNLTKIKIKYDGKTLLEIPLSAAYALQIIGLFAAPLATILLSVRINRIFTVEVINKVVYNYELAVKYHERGDLGKAEEYYKRSIDISHYFVPSHLNLGLLYRQMGESKKAVVCFKKVLSMVPFGEIGKIAKENLEGIRGF